MGETILGGKVESISIFDPGDSGFLRNEASTADRLTILCEEFRVG